MGQFVIENAHNRTDLKKYHEEHKRIFGEKPPEFCDECGFRFSYCECNLDNEEQKDGMA